MLEFSLFKCYMSSSNFKKKFHQHQEIIRDPILRTIISLLLMSLVKMATVNLLLFEQIVCMCLLTLTVVIYFPM